MALNKQADSRVVSQRAEAERLRGRKHFITMKTMIFLIALSFLYVSCYDTLGEKTYYIEITNNSNKTIKYKASLDYPDTLIRFSAEKLSTLYASEDTHEYSWSKWNEAIPSGVFQLFIFDIDTLNKYPWDSIKNNRNRYIRREYSIGWLDLNEYKIKYP